MPHISCLYFTVKDISFTIENQPNKQKMKQNTKNCYSLGTMLHILKLTYLITITKYVFYVYFMTLRPIIPLNTSTYILWYPSQIINIPIAQKY